MNVAIDVGNTLIKAGIFEEKILQKKLIFDHPDQLKDFLKNFPAQHCIISSVKGDAADVARWVNATGGVVLLNPALPLPIRNTYETPDTLGVDRLAAVCGAKDLFPARNCLVINAGTCITYDVIDEHSGYQGGAISPGLRMRFKAMKSFTARLPLVEPVPDPPHIGKNTVSCMQSGVIWGMAAELDGVIASYKEIFPELQVILTGGDSQFFENKLKASIFAGPELVLSGLNSILLYNVSA